MEHREAFYRWFINKIDRISCLLYFLPSFFVRTYLRFDCIVHFNNQHDNMAHTHTHMHKQAEHLLIRKCWMNQKLCVYSDFSALIVDFCLLVCSIHLWNLLKISIMPQNQTQENKEFSNFPTQPTLGRIYSIHIFISSGTTLRAFCHFSTDMYIVQLFFEYMMYGALPPPKSSMHLKIWPKWSFA